MSQTPTKGPEPEPEKAAVERWILNRTVIEEALNIHHETKQTPRQILESREALRVALELALPIVDEILEGLCLGHDGSCGPESCCDASCADVANLAITVGKMRKALTLAKEGGQA